MSKETLTHLNTQTLIGYTEKRGTAWHYRAEEQGTESNHYPSSIPVADVKRRLFGCDALEGNVQTTVLTDDGVTTYSDPTRKAIVRSDTGAILGIFKQGYKIHPYAEWLISNVENVLDADAQIASAGLLAGGARAWVQIEMDDTCEVQGFEFRPFLTAATSLDGSLATTYIRGAQAVVCDNTLSAALGSASEQIKIRHSVNSLGRLSDARDALGIIHEVAEDFAAQVEALTAEKVSAKRWAKFVDAYAGPASDSKLAISMSANKVDTMNFLWNTDERVTPWAGTAFGVLQAVNTYAHHFAIAQHGAVAERNMRRVVEGKHDALDRGTLALLATV
jgi:phage/plasmid-like protein (TIGR03299 family)